MQITKARLKELERIEAKMAALEGAGVDSWEGYSIAMEEIEKQERVDVAIEDAVHKAIEVLGEGLCEMSEPGAGLGITEEAEEEAYEVLKKCLMEIQQITI